MPTSSDEEDESRVCFWQLSSSSRGGVAPFSEPSGRYRPTETILSTVEQLRRWLCFMVVFARKATATMDPDGRLMKIGADSSSSRQNLVADLLNRSAIDTVKMKRWPNGTLLPTALVPPSRQQNGNLGSSTSSSASFQRLINGGNAKLLSSKTTPLYASANFVKTVGTSGNDKHFSRSQTFVGSALRSMMDESSVPEYQQATFNSILTLHSVSDVGHMNDSCQERRLNDLEGRLRDIEQRLVVASRNLRSEHRYDQQDSPDSAIGNDFSFSPISPMDMNVSTVRADSMVGCSRTNNTFKCSEDLAREQRVQLHIQIDRLTKRLVSSEELIQTLRLRNREMELENEIWQNRCRLHDDIDVEKLLRENDHLRVKQRRLESQRRSLLDESVGKERAKDEEIDRLKSQVQLMEKRCDLLKQKYKQSIRAYKNQRRQDNLEIESLKVTTELQNAELSYLRKRLFGQLLEIEEKPLETEPTASTDESLLYNVSKCSAIADCLTEIGNCMKRKEALDPLHVLEYSQFTESDDSEQPEERNTAVLLKSRIENLATKLTNLHSVVIDLYGDEMADSVTCNVQ